MDSSHELGSWDGFLTANLRQAKGFKASSPKVHWGLSLRARWVKLSRLWEKLETNLIKIQFNLARSVALRGWCRLQLSRLKVFDESTWGRPEKFAQLAGCDRGRHWFIWRIWGDWQTSQVSDNLAPFRPSDMNTRWEDVEPSADPFRSRPVPTIGHTLWAGLH